MTFKDFFKVLPITDIHFLLQTQSYQPHLNFNSFFNPINPNYFNPTNNLLATHEPINSSQSSSFDPLANQTPAASETIFNQSETFNYFPLKTSTDDANNILTYQNIFTPPRNLVYLQFCIFAKSSIEKKVHPIVSFLFFVIF